MDASPENTVSIDSMNCAHDPAGPSQLRITELFSAQVACNPDAVAVEHNGRVITYGTLDSVAGRLAGYLRTLGVGPNVVVGLCLARSIAMVVGALAILKAGGAYLPLDPAYPTNRLAFQLQDAQVPVLLTGKCLTESLPAGPWRTVGLDPEGCFDSVGSWEPAELPAVRPDNLAYVIYTSGSTGQPKGVEITHGALENLVSWHQQAFAVTPRDRAPLQASPGFDGAVWELWPYLTAGASVYVADDEGRSEPVRFRDWLLHKGITIAFAPTAMAEYLIRLDWPAHCFLRILLTGADTLRHRPAATLPFTLVNNYGPTECTVVTTSGVVLPHADSDGLPPIGRPITNVQVYVLDEDLHRVPEGEAGELYIGGTGLARGYRNRPDLTGERFVTIPWAKEPGSARLYRTGDRGVYLPDGQIRFLGRNDDQIKIRGYRVELDEVAAVLDSHPAVAASVVVCHEANDSEKQLVAYLMFKPNERAKDRDLRDYLFRTLPKYMMPAVFCRLDSLPLTASGKVDRKALPSAAEAERLGDEPYVPPRTPIEARVAALLSELLHLETVGVTDNFFMIGGNSLLGAQVIARVRDAFNVDLPLLSLFDHPTIAELSMEIEELLIAQLDPVSDEEAQRMWVSSTRRAA
jgi:amino acid adenylation domain-containing protein